MCELWVHFLGTSWYIPYFNLDPTFWGKLLICCVNCEFISLGTSWYISLLQFCPKFWGKFRGVTAWISEWVHWELHETWVILTVTGLNFELTIKGGEPLCILWAACLKKSLTFVWRILPTYSLEKASFLFQETSPLFNGQASSLIQESSLVHIRWKKVHLCLTKCHPTWHQQTQKNCKWKSGCDWLVLSPWATKIVGQVSTQPHHMFKHRWKLNTNFQ